MSAAVTSAKRRAPKGEPMRCLRIVPMQAVDHLDAIIEGVKGRGRAGSSIFVLDQYGYSAAPPVLLRRIFDHLPNAEVFLTLATGWVTAYLPDLRTAGDRLGIGQDVVDRVAAFEEDGPSIADDGERPTLQRLQILLKEAFTTETGAAFYTPFFIVSRESNRSYWFLHMANNARANDVVKTLHWSVENHFQHFGGAGLAMLGYDPSRDPEVTGQSVLPFFFDDAARGRTTHALGESLPARIAREHPNGVRFADLFAGICNETPATKAMLAASVRDLCMARELEKRGGEGERRATTTAPKNDDLIQLSRQRSLFGRRR